ncbi:MAG: class I SAM-dependent methyltransferase, partial [Acidobacteriota bacterium]
MENQNTRLKASPKTAWSVVTRTTCRACGNGALTDVLSLGNQCISDFLDRELDSPSAPLEIVLCDVSAGGCGLLQLRHTADQGFLYRNYWYRSGVNSTMRNALADIASKAQELVSLKKDDIVIDTGSNDNTLLRLYENNTITRVGFEPAT